MGNIFDFLKNKYNLYPPDAFLDKKLSLMNQEWELREDIVQITHNDVPDILLDIGWYGDFEFDNSARFILYVIKDCDWDKPLLRKETKSISELEAFIKESLIYLEPN